MDSLKKYALFLLVILNALSSQIRAQLPTNQNSKVSVVNKSWQFGGLFSGKNPQQEILAGRTEYTKKFDCGKGIVDIYFGGPFHYRDLNGAWQDISLNIKTQDKPTFKYLNEENTFKSQFAANAIDGVRMTYKNKSLLFGIDSKIRSGSWEPQQSSNKIAVVEGSKLGYKNIYNDIDLKYELTTNAILHKLLFKNKDVFVNIPQEQEFVSIEETLQIPENAVIADNTGTINLDRVIKGNVFIILKKDTLYTIKSAKIWDASFSGTPDEQSNSSEAMNAFKSIQTSIHFLSKTTLTLTALIPINWLRSADRVYPIIFDPTVNVGNASSFSSDYRYPFNTCRQQRLSQIFFKKTDINTGGINTAGTITDIAFFQNTANPMANNNVAIKMQEVTWNSMTTSTPTSSGWSNVYGPSTENYTSGSNTWRSLHLSNPFNYSNTNNLLIEASFSNSTYTTGCSCNITAPGGYWAWYTAPYAGHRWAYSNSASSPPSGTDCNYVNSPEDNPAYGYFIPITKITVNTISSCTPISIISNPSSQNVVAGTSVLFSISVDGTAPSYQWDMSSDGGISWNNVPTSAPYSGTTTNQLTISTSSSAMNGTQYHCKIFNGCTTPAITSNVAVLTVGGVGCSTVLTPTASASMPVTGGGGSVNINVTPNSCSWSASATDPWIAITSPHNGTGDATLSYTAAPNTNPSRNGTIIINGQVYNVNQQGVGIPTTYIISGRVTDYSSNAIRAGVLISTIPNQGTTTTDANGYYTLTVPSGYVGSVKATLVPFTFTPLSLPVSSTNNTNKNFDYSPVSGSISITSSIIPPWQREGDDYNGSVTVKVNNAASWHLEADVYDANNFHWGNVKYPSTIAATYKFSALGSPNQQLIGLSKNGRVIKYAAVFDANTSVQAYPGTSTNIIEEIWNKKNIVFYNDNASDPMANFHIPLKYLSNARKIRVRFDIDRNSCSTNPQAILLNGSILFSGGQTVLSYDPNLSKYIDVNGSNSNIRHSDVFPGEWTCFIDYLDENGNLISTQFESETFELTKIGKVNSGGSRNNLVVFIGGWNNKIEKDIEVLPMNDLDYSSQGFFSLSKFKEWTNNNIETWYIAQAGTNYTQRNAYSVGIALDSILMLRSNVNEINLITHSKGGMDVRALMGGYAVNYKDFYPTFDDHIDNQHKEFFNSFKSSTKIRKIIFLTAPHNGANFFANIANTFGGSPAIKELRKQDNYKIINELNANGKIPDAIDIGNLTGYEQVPKFSNGIPGYSTSYSFDFTDGVVKGESSDCISDDQSVESLGWPFSKPLRRSNGDTVRVLQMYQHAYAQLLPNRVHTIIHKNNTLSNYLPKAYSLVNQTSSSLTNIDKIVWFMRNGLSNTFPTCPRPTVSRFSAALVGSKLSGATLSVKFKNEDQYYPFGISDGNGDFNGTVIPSLQYWDSIKVEAANVDRLQLKVGTQIINSGKISLVMLKSNFQTNHIQYPSLSLLNQNPITNQPIIKIKATARNATSILINQHSSINSFSSLDLNNNIANIALDTGYNQIIVKFCGVDTAIQINEVYYLPDTLMIDYAMKCSVSVPSTFRNSRMFVNNAFYKDITANDTFMLLKGVNEVKFSKYGYRDTVFIIDTVTAIHLSMQPYSYSGLSDSTIFNFANDLNPQYWKTVTVKRLSALNKDHLSVMQYDDSFTGMSVKSLTRKFVFRRLYSSTPALFKTAIALDQINTPDKDSVYLLTKKENSWIKYKANEANSSEYDPEVQKLEFDKLNFDNNNTYELCLMQKQAPIMKDLDTVWHSGQTIAFPLSIFVQDPDSIKNDIAISSMDAKVSVFGNLVYLTAPINFIGTISYSLTGIHDYLEVSKSYKMKVIPPEVYIPTAFTPNNDGFNDILRPSFLGKVANCHMTIFNRNGQKIFETQDCLSGWDGKFNGEMLNPGTFVYYLTYQFEGENAKLKKGSFVLIK